MGLARRIDDDGSPARRCIHVMPSLIRFLIGVAVLAGLAAVAVWVLANFVEPRPREMTIRVPQERLDPR